MKNHKLLPMKTVRVPVILSNFKKDEISLMIYSLFNELYLLNELKEKALDKKYQETKQVRIYIKEIFKETLQFICKNEKLSIQDVVKYSLILHENDPMFFNSK
jgi:predicted nucleotide-binding protein (sugar kinase/HSP70/actin superfamily)